MEFTKMLTVTDKWDLCALHFLLLIYLELSNSTVNPYCFSKTKSYLKKIGMWIFYFNNCWFQVRNSTLYISVKLTFSWQKHEIHNYFLNLDLEIKHRDVIFYVKWFRQQFKAVPRIVLKSRGQDQRTPIYDIH